MADESRGPTLYERVVNRRERLDYGLSHSDEIVNFRLVLDCLAALLTRNDDPKSDEEVAAEYESMEEAAFGVAKAAKAYVEAVGGGAGNTVGIVEAYERLEEEVRKYNECADQYESNFV